MAHSLFFVKFYENTDMPIHLLNFSCWFGAQAGEVNSCEGDWLPETKIFTTWLFTEGKKS